MRWLVVFFAIWWSFLSLFFLADTRRSESPLTAGRWGLLDRGRLVGGLNAIVTREVMAKESQIRDVREQFWTDTQRQVC